VERHTETNEVRSVLATADGHRAEVGS